MRVFSLLFIKHMLTEMISEYSREEFAEFLTAVQINFSRKKWNQIFRDIDTSHDDLVRTKEKDDLPSLFFFNRFFS